jgi:hypothetical protein
MKRLFLITPICVGIWVLGTAQTTHQAKFSAILNNANREFVLKSKGGDILQLLKPLSITDTNAEKPFKIHMRGFAAHRIYWRAVFFRRCRRQLYDILSI